MQNAKQQQYLKVRVETASPGELTLLLYQEMVKLLLQAKQLYSQNQYEEMNQPLYKVKSILSELIVTLDMKYDISRDLQNLYLFYDQHIANFIIKKDESILNDILDFARGMAETWKQALASLKTGGYQENA
ncbi:flagellar export chaperone FliS [Paenibacillus chitinolyticus]|uniref:Flagellar export chaperone FliS n=1 Tax=Paenibacillus chitinolyticus TaxID=79263 RepID=A0A410WQP1_9BACL|nr:flagellar export chaperone FliS [Paenibacillus chitinolyticus]MCY9591688.1 flagellar export chaperone FliS [Paenibacillus chitinolyticus]MCY9596047.1 flagellar export chaperone FliS [Paenibacillus chitinolyticus]QAV16661.1 flagellar export chaperone FliS [Paenibacillus chitinolyticus]